jgi:flagellar basal body rod protein FlgG
MFYNQNLSPLKNALEAAEDLRRISAINIANANTVGYKALEGVFAPDCLCECECFADVLPKVAQECYQGQLHLEMVKSNKPGQKIKINGQTYEGSNVDTSKELNNIVRSASLTRSALAAVQLENKIQTDALNSLRGA